MKIREKRKGKKQIKKAIVSGLIAVFVMSLVTGLAVSSVSATWCNNDYGKKTPILINNTGGSAQTYYQVMLNYTYDSDMNSDFSDARVYNESDCSLIPFWNESAVPSSWNTIWFNASNVSASSWTNDTYYLYYNYSSASSVSDGDATFPWFDQFDTNTESDYNDVDDKYQWSSEFTGWTRDSNNPIIGGGAGGDGTVRRGEEVIIKENDSMYHLYYAEYPDGSQNYYHRTSSSFNGTFSNEETILTGIAGHGGMDILFHPENHTAIKLSESDLGISSNTTKKYWMFYNDGDTLGDSNIDIATNTDLNGTWTKETVIGNNVLTPSAGEWDAGRVGWDYIVVFEDNGTYHMLYGGSNSDASRRQGGYATSTNLTNWTKSASNPVIANGTAERWDGASVGPQDIWKNGSMFVLVYTGYGVPPVSDNEDLGIATSTDLTNWTKTYDNLNRGMFGAEGWESSCSDFALWRDINKDYIFYEAGVGGSYGIGRAWCDDILNLQTDGVMKGTENAGGDYRALLNNLSLTNYAVRAKLKTTSNTGYVGVTAGYTDSGNCLYLRLYPNENTLQLRERASSTIYVIEETTSYAFSSDTYYTIELRRIDTDVWGWLDGEGVVLSGTATHYTTTNEPSGLMHSNNPTYFDNLIVRKYTSPEPTAQLGTEQTAGEGDCTTPAITDLTNSTPGTTNATITWSTNQSADNRVKYSKYSDLSNETWSSWDNDTTTVSIDLTSLDANTLYYYQATSYNGTNSGCSITEPVSSPYKNFTTQSSGGEAEITLTTGWNIFGYTNSTATDASGIADKIGSNCSYVTERNKTTGNYVNFNPAAPAENNFAVEHGWGYYVSVSSDTNLTMTASTGSYEITLPNGWCIFGWTNTTTGDANYVATDIGGNCTYVTERNKTTGNYVNFNPAAPAENNFAVEHGWGYYAKVSAETVWNRMA